MRYCKRCSAVKPGQRTLYYEPLRKDNHLAVHPCIERKAQKRITQRAAKATERRIEKSIAKGTLRSGAANGDGDLELLSNLRVEVKRRGHRKSWNLTWAEYEKGKRQGIDVYAIESITPHGQDKTIYMMEEELFTLLLNLLRKELHKDS